VGVPFAVLVNGREWSFYLPAEQGSYLDRRVYKLDLLERESAESVRVLERYLRADRIKDRSAIEDAKRDYLSAAREREARDAIPRVWQEVVTEPDESLLEIIAERVERLVGFRPAAEQVEAFLVTLADTNTKPADKQPVHKAIEKAISESKGRGLEVTILGSTTRYADGISALIAVLTYFHNKNSDFLQKFAQRAPGRTRNHISRNRAQVYPDKPQLEQYATKLADGWWLGTNMANREKDRLARIACEVAGLKFGRDVIVNFPNTQSAGLSK
jgi:predicted type IV restriction endonuclease